MKNCQTAGISVTRLEPKSAVCGVGRHHHRLHRRSHVFYFGFKPGRRILSDGGCSILFVRRSRGTTTVEWHRGDSQTEGRKWMKL